MKKIWHSMEYTVELESTLFGEALTKIRFAYYPGGKWDCPEVEVESTTIYPHDEPELALNQENSDNYIIHYHGLEDTLLEYAACQMAEIDECRADDAYDRMRDDKAEAAA